MSHADQILKTIDWKLLREQKAYCLNESSNCQELMEIYDGVIQMIDALQDAAVRDGVATELEVFGHE